MENIAIKLALSDNKLKELNAEEYFQVKQKAEDLTKESEDLVNKNIDLKNTEAELRLAIIQSNETLEKQINKSNHKRKSYLKSKNYIRVWKMPWINFFSWHPLPKIRFAYQSTIWKKQKLYPPLLC